MGWRCLAVLIVMATGCAGRADPFPTDSREDLSGSAAYAVTLYRSPCSGHCPMYSVSVTPDGLVAYEGRGNVHHIGAATARIDRSQVKALSTVLEAAGYFEFVDVYRPSEAVCGRYVPTAPTVITSLRLGNRSKRIEHDHGCGGAPQALGVLERRIDEVLGTVRWTGR
jgi:hypothetical protein